MLPSKEDWSFVCCLSSLNLLHYDAWKDTDLVETMTYFLDAVMEEFIVKLEAMRDSEDKEKRQAFRFMERAYNFASQNRALGLGVLGYHSLLQSKSLAFDSKEAEDLNVKEIPLDAPYFVEHLFPLFDGVDIHFHAVGFELSVSY